MNLLNALSGIGLAVAMSSSQAGTISLNPFSQTGIVGGTAAVDLVVDIRDLEPVGSIGGGLDITVGGAASYDSFTPSVYFTDLIANAFDAGFGTANSAGDLEVHFIDFLKLPNMDVVQTIGTIIVNLDAPGQGTIDLSVNTLYDFPDVTNGAITLENAIVNAVPVPAAVWLFGSGLIGLIGVARRKVQQA